MNQDVSIVVAMDEKGGIGVEGDLPWRLPADMRFFKELTIGNGNNAVFMGRKTWESIPDKFRPLEDRTNIVLTKSPQKDPKAFVVASSLDDALEKSKGHEKVFCIGGASIYKQVLAMKECKELFITEIAKTFSCDAFFPEFKKSFSFKETVALGFDNGLDYKIGKWQRM